MVRRKTSSSKNERNNNNEGKTEMNQMANLGNENGSISTISERNDKDELEKYLSLLETPQQSKERKRSHIIAYVTMAIMTVGFSITLSGTWPYLTELLGEESVEKTALGWVTAANPLGQIIASPLIGMVGNKVGKIRVLCYFTISCYILGNMMYALLPYCTDFWDNSAYHLMILSRFVVGISSSNITLCRSYIASSTTTKERTKGMSWISASQSIGFIVGPIIQMILSLAINDDLYKYGSTGYVAVTLGIVNLFLMTPILFKESNIAEKEAELMKQLDKTENEDEENTFKRDYVAIWGLVAGLGFSMMFFVFMETLSVPFLTDQYGWEDHVVVAIFGGMIIACGIMAIVMLISVNRLAKRFDERVLLIVLGYVPLAIGVFLILPLYTDEPMVMSECTNVTASSNIHQNNSDRYRSPLSMSLSSFSLMTRDDDNTVTGPNGEEYEIECTPGCPTSQEWCYDVPRLPYAQLAMAEISVFIGYPVVMAFTIALYSKCLGPRPQGLWMALLTEIIAISRIIGPISATYMYTYLGTYWCFGLLSAGMFLCVALLVFIHKRIPKTEKIPKHTDTLAVIENNNDTSNA